MVGFFPFFFLAFSHDFLPALVRRFSGILSMLYAINAADQCCFLSHRRARARTRSLAAGAIITVPERRCSAREKQRREEAEMIGCHDEENDESIDIHVGISIVMVRRVA